MVIIVVIYNGSSNNSNDNGSSTPNLPANIVDVRGFDSSIILILKGWNSYGHREFPGKFESSDVSRDNVSGEIGRTVGERGSAPKGGRHSTICFNHQRKQRLLFDMICYSDSEKHLPSLLYSGSCNARVCV